MISVESIFLSMITTEEFPKAARTRGFSMGFFVVSRDEGIPSGLPYEIAAGRCSGPGCIVHSIGKSRVMKS